MRKILFIAMFAAVMVVIFSFSATAKKPAFGNLYYNGEIVRTVVPPATMPFQGRDNLYPFPGAAADGQLPITAVAPGDKDYHGGQWAVHLVDWLTEPYLLTSEADVLDAETNGDVAITRMPDLDFKCPVQP